MTDIRSNASSIHCVSTGGASSHGDGHRSGEDEGKREKGVRGNIEWMSCSWSLRHGSRVQSVVFSSLASQELLVLGPVGALARKRI